LAIFDFYTAVWPDFCCISAHYKYDDDDDDDDDDDWCTEKVCSLQCAEGAAPVYGVAVVDQCLFVVRAWSTYVEVYDSTTYSPLHHLSVPRLVDVTDMAGCERYSQLYLTDNDSRAVHTVATEHLQVKVKKSKVRLYYSAL